MVWFVWWWFVSRPTLAHASTSDGPIDPPFYNTRQKGFLDAVQARDVEAVGMFLDEGYQVHSKSLLEAVRLGALDIVKVRAGVRGAGGLDVDRVCERTRLWE